MDPNDTFPGDAAEWKDTDYDGKGDNADLDDDGDGMGVNEYPKYPIEMLWEHAGDCEDAASLYVSLMESIGYDALLILLLVKPNENEDWGGHAMPAIYIPNATEGEGVQLDDESKSGMTFQFAEEQDGTMVTLALGLMSGTTWITFTSMILNNSYHFFTKR